MAHTTRGKMRNERELAHSDYNGLFTKGQSLGQQVAEYFRARGLDATCNTSTQNGHVRVKGQARTVDFYPTTGTIHANPVKGKYRAYKLRGASNERGLERVVSLATHGH